MNQLKLDENLAIREVLDDIIGMVSRREKLIESAAQQAERTRDERMSAHVKQLEELMSDFVGLFDPILVKVKAYAESLKESIGESEGYLKSLVGIIDAGKSIEGSSATLQELERDAEDVQLELDQSSETLKKIDDLFDRTKQYRRVAPTEKIPNPGSAARERAMREINDPSQATSRRYLITRPRLASYESSKGQR